MNMFTNTGQTTLYLTRHGETEWNVQKRLQGHLDSPLTELGKKQAAWLEEALRVSAYPSPGYPNQTVP
jgi:probable phosphoglycerate mutase